MAKGPFRERRVPVSVFLAKFRDILDGVRVQGNRIILTRRGVNVAALIPVEDLQALELVEEMPHSEVSWKAARDGGKRPEEP